MKNRILSILAALSFLTAGCAHGQPAPTPSPVIAWTLTPGAGAVSAWTQTLFVATVPSLTSACPTPGGSAYTSKGTATGTATSLTDSAEEPGTIICALDQNSEVVSGVTLYSGYSATSAPFLVPAIPTAPGTPSANVTTAMLAPALKRDSPHTPTLAKSSACFDCLTAYPAPGAPVPHVKSGI